MMTFVFEIKLYYFKPIVYLRIGCDTLVVCIYVFNHDSIIINVFVFLKKESGVFSNNSCVYKLQIIKGFIRNSMKHQGHDHG